MVKEFEIIDKYFKPLTNSCKASQNLSDDVAKIKIRNDEELVISKDIFVEDVHFLKKDGAFKIAEKLLRTNLSDIASSGAKPIYYMLGFSKNNDKKFLIEFSRGLKSVQNQYNLSLIGGDTIKSDKLFFSVTIFGIAKKSKILTRSQAKAGDLIFVSGSIGDAFLGLNSKELLSNFCSKSDYNFFLQRHFFPTPRIELGQKLLEKKLSNCAIDISDGLLADLFQICKSSNVSADVKLNKIPFSKAAKKVLQKNAKIKISDLISAGDDYEIIFSSNSKNRKKIKNLGKDLNLDLTCIGEFKQTLKGKNKITLFDDNNQKILIEKLGYEH